MLATHPHLGLAVELADRARHLLADGAADFGTAEAKDDGTPVTKADRDCETALREILGANVPDHGIWGEEFGVTKAASTWVLDPIDGTKAFITGSPLFATLIALVEEGQPVLGVIEFPALQQRWLGGGGTGQHEHAGGTTPLAPRLDAPQQLAQANIATTRPAQTEAVSALLNACAQVRYGGDAFNFACVATGTLELAVDEGLQPYDYAALLPVLAAGGCAWADFNGDQPAFGETMDIIVAANDQLLAMALRVLQGN